MCRRMIAFGQLIVALWCVLYLFGNPLLLAPCWLPLECRTHGSVCPCPEMCQQAAQHRLSAEATVCGMCKSAEVETVTPAEEPAPSSGARGLISGRCGYEQQQALAMHAYPYLPSAQAFSAYAPMDREDWANSSPGLPIGYRTPPFHPPEL